MLTSSPADFWKYADIGSTPMRPPQLDLSPSKPAGKSLPPQSSSPPPPARSRSPIASPTRGARAGTQDTTMIVEEEDEAEEEEEETGGFDLTKWVVLFT